MTLIQRKFEPQTENSRFSVLMFYGLGECYGVESKVRPTRIHEKKLKRHQEEEPGEACSTQERMEKAYQARVKKSRRE